MKKITILVVVLVLIGGGIWLTKRSPDGSIGPQMAKYTEPADAVDAFYKDWLKAVQDPATTPNRATLATSPLLTKELSAQVTTALQSGATLDPVLCQSAVPQGITIRNVYTQADKAQILVTSKDKSVTKQAVVTLNKSSDS